MTGQTRGNNEVQRAKEGGGGVTHRPFEGPPHLGLPPSPLGEGVERHEVAGLVLEILRMSTEDGPGLRTTVFLKGCSLACRWCHNPESIASFPEVQWVGSRCIGCGSCMGVCERKALSASEAPALVAIDRTRCKGCAQCVEVCPTTALEKLGTWWSAEALALELAKDRAFFERSGGGVTISGGEPTMQGPFLSELSARLREMRIHVAVDTCGQCVQSGLDALLLHCDLVLFDLKVLDPVLHKELTGHDNRRILQNLERLAAHPRVTSGEVPVWIRTPIIPGDTDSARNVVAIAGLLASRYSSIVAKYELCAFNNLGQDKYKRLGRQWPYEGIPLLAASELDSLVATAVFAGLSPEVVRWTGSAASDPQRDAENRIALEGNDEQRK